MYNCYLLQGSEYFANRNTIYDLQTKEMKCWSKKQFEKFSNFVSSMMANHGPIDDFSNKCNDFMEKCRDARKEMNKKTEEVVAHDTILKAFDAVLPQKELTECSHETIEGK